MTRENREHEISREHPQGLRVQLARVALVTTPPDEMQYAPIDNVRYLDVVRDHPDGPIIGTFNIQYFPATGAQVKDVKIEEAERGQELGIEIYRSVPFLPLPFQNGGSFREHNLWFRSGEYDSDDAISVWKRLARDGFAKRIGERRYQMHPKVPRPRTMTVEEFDL